MSDALAGFLPPNVVSPAGQGFVEYTVRSRGNGTTGTSIAAAAQIVFDTNEPIGTPTFINTIDAAGPSSAVTALPETTLPASFLVSWSGSDDADSTAGSGVAWFDVFVSDNGGPFAPFVTGTAELSATFMGEAGHTYTFYTIAVDGAGNREAAPAVPDTQTTLVATPGTIKGRAFQDSNGDGLFDPLTELVLAARTV